MKTFTRWITIPALILLAACAAALSANAQPMGNQYATLNWLERVPQSAERATRFQTGTELTLLDEAYFWGFAKLRGSYNLTGTGLLDQESAPFTVDHKPAVYLYRDLSPSLALSVGFVHESNGQDGRESRAWERYFATLSVDHQHGPWRVVGNATVWNVMQLDDTTSDFLYELRAVGDSEWGFEGEAQVQFQNDAILTVDLRDNFAIVGLGLNPTDGENLWFPSLFAGTVKGQNLVSNDTPERFLGAGLTLAR